MPRSFQRFRPRSLPPLAGPTRREVLARSLAAAGLLLTGCASRERRRDSAPRVVVVGAGLAGLSCAHELRARGADVSVLEARARVGGRVLSFDDVIDGASVEGGGEFIGANHPHWLGYAQRLGLELTPILAEDENLAVPIVLNGERISNREAETLWREAEQMQTDLTQLAREVDPEAPWNHSFAGALDMRHMWGWVEERQVSRLGQHFFRVMLAADAGMSTKKQSLLGALAMVAGGGHEAFWSSSESYRCSGGNARLARALAGAVGSERIVMSSPVTRIRWSETSVEVETKGSVITADRLVLAIPPTTWPRIEFDPPLPGGIAPQLGHSVKEIVTLDRAAWTATNTAPDSVSDGPISLTWSPPATNSSGRRALICFASGEAADHLRSTRGATHREVVLSELDALQPGAREAFVASRFMDWPGEEWTRAGYSFPAPGEITTRLKRLREPFGALIVAGEHTSTSFPGYMEGALESGVRAARLAYPG